ncbi:MAG: hypothetical protein AB9873_08120 [Syntrophobacteraceae bacterium]
MADQTRGVAERDVLPTILTLLTKQQRIIEHTSRLVESRVADVGHFREQSERLAILTQKLDSLEKLAADFDKKRLDCIQNVAEQFRLLEEKREQNKDRIGLVEKQLADRVHEIELALLNRTEDDRKELEGMISNVCVDVASVAAKYGGVVAVLVSLLVGLIQWALGHAHSSPGKVKSILPP